MTDPKASRHILKRWLSQPDSLSEGSVSQGSLNLSKLNVGSKRLAKTFHLKRSIVMSFAVVSMTALPIGLPENFGLAQAWASDWGEYIPVDPSERPEISSDVPELPSVHISGPDVVDPLNTALGTQFLEQVPGANVEISSRDTQDALNAVQSGDIDLAIIDRPLTSDETAKGLVAVPIDENLAYVYDGPTPSNIAQPFLDFVEDPSNQQTVQEAATLVQPRAQLDESAVSSIVDEQPLESDIAESDITSLSAPETEESATDATTPDPLTVAANDPELTATNLDTPKPDALAPDSADSEVQQPDISDSDISKPVATKPVTADSPPTNSDIPSSRTRDSDIALLPSPSDSAASSEVTSSNPLPWKWLALPLLGLPLLFWLRRGKNQSSIPDGALQDWRDIESPSSELLPPVPSVPAPITPVAAPPEAPSNPLPIPTPDPSEPSFTSPTATPSTTTSSVTQQQFPNEETLAAAGVAGGLGALGAAAFTQGPNNEDANSDDDSDDDSELARTIGESESESLGTTDDFPELTAVPSDVTDSDVTDFDVSTAQFLDIPETIPSDVGDAEVAESSDSAAEYPELVDVDIPSQSAIADFPDNIPAVDIREAEPFGKVAERSEVVDADIPAAIADLPDDASEINASEIDASEIDTSAIDSEISETLLSGTDTVVSPENLELADSPTQDMPSMDNEPETPEALLDVPWGTLGTVGVGAIATGIGLNALNQPETTQADLDASETDRDATDHDATDLEVLDLENSVETNLEGPDIAASTIENSANQTDSPNLEVALSDPPLAIPDVVEATTTIPDTTASLENTSVDNREESIPAISTPESDTAEDIVNVADATDMVNTSAMSDIEQPIPTAAPEAKTNLEPNTDEIHNATDESDNVDGYTPLSLAGLGVGAMTGLGLADLGEGLTQDAVDPLKASETKAPNNETTTPKANSQAPVQALMSEPDVSDDKNDDGLQTVAFSKGKSCHQWLTIHSPDHNYTFDENQLSVLQATANRIPLTPGCYVLTLDSENTKIKTSPEEEPNLSLWLYGGRFINRQTNVEATSTWATLSGYNDILTLDVLESTTVCILFFDTVSRRRSTKLTLLILKDEE